MTQYIDKAAVVAEIKELTNIVCDLMSVEGSVGAECLSERILSFLDTLEVKEVDLKKEFRK